MKSRSICRPNFSAWNINEVYDQPTECTSWCTSHVPDERIRITRSGRGVIKIIIGSSWEQFLLHFTISTATTIFIIINIIVVRIITWIRIVIEFSVIIILKSGKIKRILYKVLVEKYWWIDIKYKRTRSKAGE